MEGAEVFEESNAEYEKYQSVKVLDVILLELDMYMYHLRVMNDVQNKGWLRNCFFSIGQQVMRQSIKYFALYCAVRPDRTTSIVAYTYYMKSQEKYQPKCMVCTFLRRLTSVKNAAPSKQLQYMVISWRVTLYSVLL